MKDCFLMFTPDKCVYQMPARDKISLDWYRGFLRNTKRENMYHKANKALFGELLKDLRESGAGCLLLDMYGNVAVCSKNIEDIDERYNSREYIHNVNMLLAYDIRKRYMKGREPWPPYDAIKKYL